MAGAVVGGDERNERGAGLVGVVVDGLALEADGSRSSIPESLFKVVMHRFGVFAKAVEASEVRVVFGDGSQAACASCVVGAFGGIAVVADHGSCAAEVLGDAGLVRD